MSEVLSDKDFARIIHDASVQQSLDEIVGAKDPPGELNLFPFLYKIDQGLIEENVPAVDRIQFIWDFACELSRIVKHRRAKDIRSLIESSIASAKEMLESRRIMRCPSEGRVNVTESLRRRIKERDDFQCQECGRRGDLEVDHIYPQSKGGSSKQFNLQTLCRPCNLSKGAKV